MKKIAPLMVIIPFFLILCSFAVKSMLDADITVSFEENRNLAQKPGFPPRDVRSFTDGYTAYVTDQFPGRPFMMRLYSEMELGMGKKNVRNTYVTKDGWLLPKEYRIADSDAQKFVDSVLKTVNDQDYRGIDFYYAVLPFKTALLYQMDGQYIEHENGESNREELIRAFSGSRLRTIDVSGYFLSTFSTDELKELFFKTDLHWNARGAYLAADCIQNKMAEISIGSGDKVDISDFIWTSLPDKFYQGDLNMRFSNLFDREEDIPVFSPVTGFDERYFLSVDGAKPARRDDIFANGVGKDTVSYGDVYTTNIGYYRVENPGAKSKKRLLILKDSLQNPTTDVFSKIFSEVDVIDPRNYREPYSLKELVETREIDVVLFMYHQDNFSPELADFLNKS